MEAAGQLVLAGPLYLTVDIMSQKRIVIVAALVVLYALTLIFTAQRTTSKQLKAPEQAAVSVGLISTVRQPLPPYHMAGIGQQEVANDVLSRGRVLLVYLTTSCKPCLEEAKIITRLNQSNSVDLRIYGVSFERPTQVASFVQELDLKFPVLIDVNGQLAQELEIHYFPSIYLIEDGTITKVWRGVTRDEADFQHQLNAH